MLERRDFLRIVGGVTASGMLSPAELLGRRVSHSSTTFAVHPFVEAHPSAVFIARTSVDTKTNAEKKYQAGYEFGKSVFIEAGSRGIPLSSIVALKPNLTCRDRSHPQYTIERSMGIVTDAVFVEGIIESMKSLGMKGSQFYIREVNCHSDFADGGYLEMAQRTGAGIVFDSSVAEYREVTDGVWFNRIGYFWPVNAAHAFLINIAKLKTHTMGMTLSAKNLQGTNLPGYHRHCTIYGNSMGVPASDVRSDANRVILDNYNRHVADGIPRWDKPGDYGGIRQETWASRCLDNNGATIAGLHIVEGIYGRDGHFMSGPSPEGLATDYMTNVILFGKNPFLVDIIGHWLGGHEPGNFGLFHLAKERGLAETINPMEIPVYEWIFDGAAILRNLADFDRTPLKTLYLRKDYNGQTEEYWHMVDEPFDYGPVSVRRDGDALPDATVLQQNYPNPFNARTTIRYSIPKAGHVRLEVFDITGSQVAVLVDGYHLGGAHLAVWEARISESGVYFYRMLFDGFSSTKAMVLLK